jgi:hypothetical protein
MSLTSHIPRILQLSIALILLVLTLCRIGWNHIGQNIINFTAVIIFGVGLDRLLMAYTYYLNKQAVEFEATFLIFCSIFLGVLFEKFNRSPQYAETFNAACYIIDILVLSLNLLFLLAVVATLAAYMVRHIYRLMTETLLTNGASLQRHEIDAIMSKKKVFS